MKQKQERKFKRALSIKNVYEKKQAVFYMDGELQRVFDNPERTGAWLIYGLEKNGKTWLSLMLANYLSTFEKVYFMSAEEGIAKSIAKTCMRININYSNKALSFNEYEPLTELYYRLKSRQAPRIVFIDNLTVYNGELKGGGLRQLLLDFPNILFIFIAHEERGEPYTAVAKLAKRLAKIIIHVNGMACTVSGRCTGGKLLIDKEGATLIHGQDIVEFNI